MNPILTQQLIARHPALLSMPKRSVIAQRGVECGDGWHRIIDDMLTEIARHCTAIGSSPPAVLQIKSKFGLLRVYVTPSDDPIQAILNDDEQKSATCCERCRRAGKLVASPFPRVTCARCHLCTTV